jgi:uncharacterized protein DUF7019
MRYYIYVSDTKVDMLYEQIPARLRGKIATEIKVDLKILSTTVSEEPRDASRLAKLKIVTEYIQKNEQVGTVDQPTDYFYGTMRLRWGPYAFRETQSVYFGGSTQYTSLGLIGSLKHVIGEIGTSQIDFSSSDVPAIMKALSRMAELSAKIEDERQSNEYDISLVADATNSLKGPTQRMEFLAKRLIEGYSHKQQQRILLGTPIYVALAE